MIDAIARPLVGLRFMVNRSNGWPEGVYVALRAAGVPVAPPAAPLPCWDPFTGVDSFGEYVRLRAEVDHKTVHVAAALGVQLLPADVTLTG